MAKKSVTAKKKSIKSKSSKAKTSSGVSKNLAKNFTDLQKVMVLQSQKIDKLTTQISGLLDLFSASARALAKKEFGPGNSEEISRMSDRIDELFDQNAQISKSIMESQTPEPMYAPSMDTLAPVPSSTTSPRQIQSQSPQPVPAAVNPMATGVPASSTTQQVPVQTASSGQVVNSSVPQKGAVQGAQATGQSSAVRA
jgi:hypothetical protein